MNFRTYVTEGKARSPDLNDIGQKSRNRDLPRLLKALVKFETKIIDLQTELEMGGKILNSVKNLAGVSAKANRDVKSTLKLLKDAQGIIGSIEANL